jgi:hypothetical protein
MTDVRVGTWNMGGGEGPDGPTEQQVGRMLRTIEREGVEVLMGQECQKEYSRSILRELGYDLFAVGTERVLVAWKPKLWVPVFKEDLVLNPNNPFHRKDNPKDIYCHLPHVRLCNPLGQSLDTGSYHTPSSVQERVKPPNRMDALREAMRTMERLNDKSLCDATCLAGDDNVDEQGGAWGPWQFMLEKETGLKQFVAPRNTLGKRKVDDIRGDGLASVGNGDVIHGPTHHNAHLRTLRIVKR